MLEIRPVQGYRDPDYPTRSIIDERPELLNVVPNRWRANPVVLATLSGACLLITSCKQSDTAAQSRVAPLFIHGEGRAAFGCVAVNPPVFLSEDEALQVINNEAKKAGLTFTKTSRTLTRVKVPVTERWGFAYEGVPSNSDDPAEKGGWERRTQPVSLDGEDTRRKIAYEFVSEDDFDAWERKSGTWASTASSVDIQEAARQFQLGLKEAKPAGTYAVFYDPAGRSGTQKPWTDEGSGAAREDGRQKLREQVRDFVKWLKAQGVI